MFGGSSLQLETGFFPKGPWNPRRSAAGIALVAVGAVSPHLGSGQSQTALPAPAHHSHTTLRGGRDLGRSSNPAPLPRQGHLEQVAWEHSGLECPPSREKTPRPPWAAFSRALPPSAQRSSSPSAAPGRVLKTRLPAVNSTSHPNVWERSEGRLAGEGEELQLMVRVKERLRDVRMVRQAGRPEPAVPAISMAGSHSSGAPPRDAAPRPWSGAGGGTAGGGPRAGAGS